MMTSKACITILIYLSLGCSLVIGIPLWNDMSKSEKEAVADDVRFIVAQNSLDYKYNEIDLNNISQLAKIIDFCYDESDKKLDLRKIPDASKSLTTDPSEQDILVEDAYLVMAGVKIPEFLMVSGKRHEYFKRYEVYIKAYITLAMLAARQPDLGIFKEVYVKAKDMEFEYEQTLSQQNEQDKQKWLEKLREYKEKSLTKTVEHAVNVYIWQLHEPLICSSILKYARKGCIDLNLEKDSPELQEVLATITGLKQQNIYDPGAQSTQRPAASSSVVKGRYRVLKKSKAKRTFDEMYEVGATVAANIVKETEKEFKTAYRQKKFGSKKSEDEALLEYKSKVVMLRMFGLNIPTYWEKFNDLEFGQADNPYQCTMKINKLQKRFNQFRGVPSKSSPGKSRGKEKQVEKYTYKRRDEAGKEENDFKIKELRGIVAAYKVVVAENLFKEMYDLLDNDKTMTSGDNNIGEASSSTA